MSRLHAAVFRATRGRLIRWWFGAPVLSLEVKGRKSGRHIHIPLVYATHPKGWVVIAANGGAPRDPQWSRNLKAAGSAKVYVGGNEQDVVPRFLEGDEKRAVRREYEKTYSTVVDYETYTDRDLPVILLERL